MSTTDQDQKRHSQQYQVMLSRFTKILVFGLGQLGLPLIKYVKERGFDAYGYDINASHRAGKTAEIKPAVDFGSGDFLFIISVSTHQPDDIFSPQIEGLLSIVKKISKEAEKDRSLISIGTSKKVFEILNHRLHVVHAPHRWHALEEKEHGVNQTRVIGGVCDCSLRAGMRFYSGTQEETYFDTTPKPYNSLRLPMHPVSNIEIAETTKIVENAHRYLQIAFTEELYLYCQANNINFPESRDALNTKWKVDILEPREGIEGHCLPKDTKMFLYSSNRNKSKILTAATEVDEDYRRSYYAK
jgi:UDP-N-acetyl-D-mannosaminuronic acid dehydrogenase